MNRLFTVFLVTAINPDRHQLNLFMGLYPETQPLKKMQSAPLTGQLILLLPMAGTAISATIYGLQTDMVII